MVKHNNQVPNAHFHKDWQRYVKTWFNQPAKKAYRRAKRLAKAKRIAPRPLEALRPIVRGQTNKYNLKVKAGRGFTLDDLEAAKINRNEARGLGISVDHRRKNRSEEGFKMNVNRLKLYKSKLIVFPRNPRSKRPKKGDASKEERKGAKQVDLNKLMPARITLGRIKPRKITDEERETVVRKVLRKAMLDEKLWGRREKRAKEKTEQGAAKKPKAAAMEADED